ncbi:YybH family protein [Longitalea luteola]|uniref:YybH family protein n=1 Tax=Longitalea luteola TaxID=2812563 RepID=UPI001A97BBEF|nr:DUF4440 domain-containing protein [Longitalea luteola]
MKNYCFLLLAAGNLFITACENAATENAANNANNANRHTAAAFDLSKARAAIESDNAKFMEEAKRGDSNALAAHYTTDGWLMFNNAEPFKGKDIVSAWGGVIRMGMKDLKITTQDVIGSAEVLAETGTYEMIGANNKTLDKGKYVVVWKPENGTWKIYRDIGNSSMPMKKP